MNEFKWFKSRPEALKLRNTFLGKHFKAVTPEGYKAPPLAMSPPSSEELNNYQPVSAFTSTIPEVNDLSVEEQNKWLVEQLTMDMKVPFYKKVVFYGQIIVAKAVVKIALFLFKLFKGVK